MESVQGIDLNSPCVQQPFWYVTLISMPSAPLPQFCRLNAAFTLQPKSPHFSVELSSSCWNWEHRFAPVWVATSARHRLEKQSFWRRHHTLFAVAPTELGPNGTIEPNLCYKLRRILLACCMSASMTVVSRIQLLADDVMEYRR
jgi:hypothetical protein